VLAFRFAAGVVAGDFSALIFLHGDHDDDGTPMFDALRFPEEEVDQRYETTLVKTFSGP
jgi:hypothetical protein